MEDFSSFGWTPGVRSLMRDCKIHRLLAMMEGKYSLQNAIPIFSLVRGLDQNGQAKPGHYGLQP